MKPIILIPARLASTRLPNKPLADLGGKPMIVRVLEKAFDSGIKDVCVACDNDEVFEAVVNAGGKAVLTPSDLPSGSDRIFYALNHIDPDKKFDTVINLQGDLPTFDPHLLEDVMAPLQEGFDISTLVSEITEEEEIDDPNVVKAILTGDPSVSTSRALYFTRATAPYGKGPLFHHIGIYGYQRAALEQFVNADPSPLEKREKLEQLRALEMGLSIGARQVTTVPLGVDTPEDLEKVRRLFA